MFASGGRVSFCLSRISSSSTSKASANRIPFSFLMLGYRLFSHRDIVSVVTSTAVARYSCVSPCCSRNTLILCPSIFIMLMGPGYDFSVIFLCLKLRWLRELPCYNNFMRTYKELISSTLRRLLSTHLYLPYMALYPSELLGNRLGIATLESVGCSV